MTLAFVHALVLCPEPDAPRVRLVPDATVAIAGGRVVSIVAGGAAPAGAQVVDAQGRLLTPGLVDAHTHAYFLGDRAGEAGARASGVSYLEIAQRGGGIRATVAATRAGSPAERRAMLQERLARLARSGVTTAEVKSGYGLSVEHELAFLEEIASAGAAHLPRVLPTLLAAHALPPEVGTEAARAAWIGALAAELVPEVAHRKLAGRVDAFVEQGACRVEEARAIARAAQANGLALHLHVDQLSDGGGAQLAAELGAQAASHLEHVSEAGVAALRAAGVVAALLPTATLVSGEPHFAPARRLIEAGVPVALATNLNPGTAPTESTALTFLLAAVGLRLAPEEILWAYTRGGARALGLLELGLLEPGAPADLVLWNAHDPAHLPYHAGVNHVRLVVREGRVIVDRSPEADRDCMGSL